MASLMSKVGAVFYAIWGLLHLNAAVEVYKLASSQQPGMVQGRLLQSAWNLAALALGAIVVSAWLNRTNSKVGYWVNLLLISVTDIGFILFIIVPGYLPVFPGVVGPVVWVLGAICTTLAYRSVGAPSPGQLPGGASPT